MGFPPHDPPTHDYLAYKLKLSRATVAFLRHFFFRSLSWCHFARSLKTSSKGLRNKAGVSHFWKGAMHLYQTVTNVITMLKMLNMILCQSTELLSSLWKRSSNKKSNFFSFLFWFPAFLPIANSRTTQDK
jgi:hypothetical protein